MSMRLDQKGVYIEYLRVLYFNIVIIRLYLYLSLGFGNLAMFLLIFNTDLVESLELHNLMAQSKVTLHSALNRTESRGAHAREDYQERDDKNWLVHSLAWLKDNGEVNMGKRAVHTNTLTNHVQPIPPKKRVY